MNNHPPQKKECCDLCKAGYKPKIYGTECLHGACPCHTPQNWKLDFEIMMENYHDLYDREKLKLFIETLLKEEREKMIQVLEGIGRESYMGDVIAQEAINKIKLTNPT